MSSRTLVYPACRLRVHSDMASAVAISLEIYFLRHAEQPVRLPSGAMAATSRGSHLNERNDARRSLATLPVRSSMVVSPRRLWLSERKYRQQQEDDRRDCGSPLAIGLLPRSGGPGRNDRPFVTKGDQRRSAASRMRVSASRTPRVQQRSWIRLGDAQEDERDHPASSSEVDSSPPAWRQSKTGERTGIMTVIAYRSSSPRPVSMCALVSTAEGRSAKGQNGNHTLRRRALGGDKAKQP